MLAKCNLTYKTSKRGCCWYKRPFESFLKYPLFHYWDFLSISTNFWVTRLDHFFTILQNELREGSNEDEDDDEDEVNYVQDRHAEYSSNGHQIQLHITSDSQDEEHPTYTNTNADDDTNDANESHYRRSYEWKRKQCWSIFCQILIVITICSNCIISKKQQVLWKIQKCVCKLTTWWLLSKLKWYEGKKNISISWLSWPSKTTLAPQVGCDFCLFLGPNFAFEALYQNGNNVYILLLQILLCIIPIYFL